MFAVRLGVGLGHIVAGIVVGLEDEEDELIVVPAGRDKQLL